MRPTLFAALLLYLLFAATTATEVGVVGEVAASWAATPPHVERVPGTAPVEHQLGPFLARETRPTETLWGLPLAVNAYTGGPADWPARLVTVALGPEYGAWTGVGLGFVLLWLTHRFLMFNASPIVAGLAGLWLATDWSFVFYRKVLGGTEVLLQAASLLVLWAVWSRRWRGGTHGSLALATGIGLGLLAKATFVATLGAVGLAVVLTRWDRARLLPPRPLSWPVLIGAPLILVSPLVIAALHHHFAGMSLLSHDSVALQLTRLGAGSLDRESLWNVPRFLGNPLGFFHDAYGAPAGPPLSVLRNLGWMVLVAGTGLEWARPIKNKQSALLRFLSIATPLQLGFLTLLNRDLHHLAQCTIYLTIWGCLAAERLAATITPPRGVGRAIFALLLVGPTLVAGARQLIHTDSALRSIHTPSFTRGGQRALARMVTASGARRLVTSDYEVYGALELGLPEVELIHTWAAFTTRTADQPPGAAALRRAEGAHYLSVLASAPLIYNWRPDPREVQRIAASEGLEAVQVARMTQGADTLAVLYRITRRSGDRDLDGARSGSGLGVGTEQHSSDAAGGHRDPADTRP